MDKGADPVITIPSISSDRESETGGGGGGVSGISRALKASIGIAAVATRIFADRRRVEAGEAALWRREAETPLYLASFISWLRSGNPWVEPAQKGPG
ncbi:hypothetical protein PG993_011781 [Apiospora rasikravindrae]|uniref:Uncharacterized protein n=1 Tax=Apiospora rasikravindrae TaxID=990691 RepID=A0ABR1S0K4_9PEZI